MLAARASPMPIDRATVASETIGRAIRRPVTAMIAMATAIDASTPTPISQDVLRTPESTISEGMARPMLQLLKSERTCAVYASRASTVNPRYHPSGACSTALRNGTDARSPAGRGGKVYAIDIKTQEVRSAATVGTRAWGIALSPDGTTLYVANGPSNDVSVVDTASMKEVTRIKCGVSPWGVAIVEHRDQ